MTVFELMNYTLHCGVFLLVTMPNFWLAAYKTYLYTQYLKYINSIHIIYLFKESCLTDTIKKNKKFTILGTNPILFYMTVFSQPVLSNNTLYFDAEGPKGQNTTYCTMNYSDLQRATFSVCGWLG